MVTHGSKHPPFERFSHYEIDMMADPLAGAGVNVYILDTGIEFPHYAWHDSNAVRNFGGLAPTDKSPYCDETMVGRYLEDQGMSRC